VKSQQITNLARVGYELLIAGASSLKSPPPALQTFGDGRRMKGIIRLNGSLRGEFDFPSQK